MEVTLIKISVLWICTALVYLLGDVLRIFKGDFIMGEVEGKKLTQSMMMFIACLMVVPILMVFLNLVLPIDVNKVVNIVVSGFFFVFNLFGIPTYKGYYDKFLLVISLFFNVGVIYYSINL